MSIRTQVALGCGVMVVVVAAFAGYSTTLNRTVAANVTTLRDRTMPQVQAAADLASAFENVEAALHHLVAAAEPAQNLPLGPSTAPSDAPTSAAGTVPASARRGLDDAVATVEARLVDVRRLTIA